MTTSTWPSTHSSVPNPELASNQFDGLTSFEVPSVFEVNHVTEVQCQTTESHHGWGFESHRSGCDDSGSHTNGTFEHDFGHNALDPTDTNSICFVQRRDLTLRSDDVVQSAVTHTDLNTEASPNDKSAALHKESHLPFDTRTNAEQTHNKSASRLEFGNYAAIPANTGSRLVGQDGSFHDIKPPSIFNNNNDFVTSNNTFNADPSIVARSTSCILDDDQLGPTEGSMEFPASSFPMTEFSGSAYFDNSGEEMMKIIDGVEQESEGQNEVQIGQSEGAHDLPTLHLGQSVNITALGTVAYQEYEEEEEADAGSDLEGDLKSRSEAHNHFLRSACKDSGPVQTSWLDQDKSGDFDPDARTAKAPRRFVGRQKASADTSTIDPAADIEASEARRLNRVQKRLHDAACRINKVSLVFTLQLSSETGRAVLASGTDNWPNSVWNTLEDQVKIKDVSEDTQALNNPFRKGYKLRARESATTAPAARPNLTGQPVARGCWSCYDLGLLNNSDVSDKTEAQGCSLVHDGTSWPCQTCLEDGHDCELITAPKVKKTCEGCKKRKLNCSYTRTSHHNGPCRECVEIGHHCIAGPNKLLTHRRIDIDCTKSIEARSICSDYGKTDKTRAALRPGLGRGCNASDKLASQNAIPLKEVHDNSRLDTKPPKPFDKKRLAVEETGLDNRKRIRALEERCHSQLKPKASGEAVCPRSQKLQIQSKTEAKVILTKLCHPVTFNYEDPSGRTLCHFCTVPSYRVLGLGPRTVTISDNHNTSIKELKGGHNSEGQDPTKICVQCTFDMIKVMSCEKHDMCEIPPQYFDAADKNDFCNMILRLVGGKSKPTDLWCSICPTAAVFMCSSVKIELGMIGCGFLLCGTCHAQFLGKYKNDFTRFMAYLPLAETDIRPFGLRADAELMKPDGEMPRFLMRMCS